MRRSSMLSVATCALVLGGGCLERRGAPVGPNVGYGQEVRIGDTGVSQVDVLFVIDDSGSMEQEQANLARQIPALVHDLASPPDRDGDGAPDWNPAQLLRIGIVTTDVGMGHREITSSGCVPGGEDGALRGGVFEWSEGDDPDAFADEVRATVVGLGLRGCAFEQPLEAAARAIEHADTTGFPNADGLLALIVVTDEEDCSVEDDDAFFSSMTENDYYTHCGRHAADLTPVDQLLERIRGDRDDAHFVYAAITGVPVGIAPDVDPASLLAREDMQFREDGRTPPRPIAVCGSDDDLGHADPARRLVELAALVPSSVVTTICTDDFGPAISEIGARIGSQIPGVCLVRELPRGLGEHVPCQVSVTLPLGDRCVDHPGYDLRSTTDGQEICALDQTNGASSGFYYDPGHATCPQLVITDDALPPIGAVVDAECFYPLQMELGEQCARSSQCLSGYCDPIADACAELPETLPPPGTTGS
ncbi:MAG: VWA domain-containing protein [Myxococcales bacterium]|nr:VWA domain-containing protein [Myxococcales bacterium]